MAEYFDEEGNKVEAFTPDEVEEKLIEEREKAMEEANALREEEISGLNEEIEAKEKELEDARQALIGEKDKEKNLSGQRKIIETRENEINNLKKELDSVKKTHQDEIDGIKKSVSEARLEEMISSVSDGDESLKEKVKFFYNNFKGEPSDTKEVKERIKNAYILATGGNSGINLSGDIVSGAGSSPSPVTDIPEGKVSPEAIPLAKKFGITDQELKKHNLA